MADQPTRQLSEYIHSVSFPRLAAETVRETKRHIIDSVGCAIGGFSAPPSIIARRMAEQTQGHLKAGVLGEQWKTSPELAAFANGVMTRYLDFNDTYPGGHPSDGLGALQGLADALGSTGKELLVSVYLLYEIFGSLNDPLQLRERGWDQGTFLSLAVACAAGKLLDLSPEALNNAIAIAASDSPTTRQTRAGELTQWKACAAPNAARNGLFAALLAKEGMTGPTLPFEGRHGLWEQVTGPFRFHLAAPEGPSPVIGRTWYKYFPIEHNAQSAATLAQQLQPRLVLSNVESVAIDTYWVAYSEIGAEPEKWTPKTRETADHSMPYIVATVLTHGNIYLHHFEESAIQDPEIRNLMAKITVREDKEYSSVYPAKLATRMKIATRTGPGLSGEVLYPKGHPQNPLTDAELEEKFRSLSEGRLAPGPLDELLRFLWNLESEAGVAPLFNLARQTE